MSALLQRHRSRQKRNEDVLECVLRHEDSVKDGYNKFLDALKRTDQENLANMITSVEKELDIVDKCEYIAGGGVRGRGGKGVRC